MSEALKYQAHYTDSAPILNYMTGMLHFHPKDSVFEPCGGSGLFVDKIREISANSNVCVYELNPTAVKALRTKYEKDDRIYIKETDTLLDDAVVTCSRKYDKIIGNPPYGARVDEKKKDLLNRIYANLYTKESYTLFLYACTKCLNENGELSFIIPDTFLSLHRHIAIRKFLLTHTKIRELTLFPSSFFPGINFGYANLCIITLTKSSDISKNLRNGIRIRTGFRSVEELEVESAGKLKIIPQQNIYESVGSAFMFNATERLTRLINDNSVLKIGDIASCVTGFYSGDDKKYLHPINSDVKNAKKYSVVDTTHIRKTELSAEEQTRGIASDDCFVPIMKGGNTEYVKPDLWYMDWSQKAVKEYHCSKKCRFQNPAFYFKYGVGIPMIRSSKLTAALIDGRLFDQSIVGVFPKDETLSLYLLGFFNSSVCTDFIRTINPSTNNSANYIKQIPFIEPSMEIRNEVETLVKEMITLLKKGEENIEQLKSQLDVIFAKLYLEGSTAFRSMSPSKLRIKELDFFDTLRQYPENIVEMSTTSDRVDLSTK